MAVVPEGEMGMLGWMERCLVRAMCGVQLEHGKWLRT